MLCSRDPSGIINSPITEVLGQADVLFPMLLWKVWWPLDMQMIACYVLEVQRYRGTEVQSYRGREVQSYIGPPREAASHRGPISDDHNQIKVLGPPGSELHISNNLGWCSYARVQGPKIYGWWSDAMLHSFPNSGWWPDAMLQRPPGQGDDQMPCYTVPPSQGKDQMPCHSSPQARVMTSCHVTEAPRTGWWWEARNPPTMATPGLGEPHWLRWCYSLD